LCSHEEASRKLATCLGPCVSNNHSTTNNQQLTNQQTNIQPTTDNRQPTTSNQQPTTNTKRPTTNCLVRFPTQVQPRGSNDHQPPTTTCPTCSYSHERPPGSGRRLWCQHPCVSNNHQATTTKHATTNCLVTLPTQVQPRRPPAIIPAARSVPCVSSNRLTTTINNQQPTAL
jgi:hypothetical protein